MQRIHTLVFDLGGVLLPFDKSSFENLLVNENTRGISRFYELDHALERQELSEGEFLDQVLHEFELKLSKDELRLAYSDIFHEEKKITRLLKPLGEKYNLYLLSNTNPIHWDFIQKKFEFLKMFHHLTLSYQVSGRKPDRHIYESTPMGDNWEGCFYVDDLPENLEYPKELGAQVHFFQDAAKLQQVLNSLLLE